MLGPFATETKTKTRSELLADGAGAGGRGVHKTYSRARERRSVVIVRAELLVASLTLQQALIQASAEQRS